MSEIYVNPNKMIEHAAQYRKISAEPPAQKITLQATRTDVSSFQDLVAGVKGLEETVQQFGTLSDLDAENLLKLKDALTGMDEALRQAIQAAY